MPLTVFLLKDAVVSNLTHQESKLGIPSSTKTSKITKTIVNVDANIMTRSQGKIAPDIDSNLVSNMVSSNVPDEVASDHPAKPLSGEELSGEAAEGSDTLKSANGKDPTSLNLSLPIVKFQRSDQENFVELANKQLGNNQKKDLLAEGIKNSLIPDCIHERQGGGLLGLPIIFYKAATRKCR